MLPTTVPVSLAAKIAGLSQAAFVKRYVDCDLVEAKPARHGGRVLVTLASLEAALGREISVEEYLSADRALDGRRQYQSEYRERKGAEGAAA